MVTSPPPLTVSVKRSRPRGAGPSLFSPTRLYFEPWHGHSNHCDDWQHGTRHPRCTHRWYSATSPSPCPVSDGLVRATFFAAGSASFGYGSRYVRGERDVERRPLVGDLGRGCRRALPTLTLPPKPLEPDGQRNARIAGAEHGRPRSRTRRAAPRLRNCRRVTPSSSSSTGSYSTTVAAAPHGRRRPPMSRASRRSARGRSLRARSTSMPRARSRPRRDWSRLRVSRDSVPVVDRRRFAVKKTVTAATRQDDDDDDGDGQRAAPTARRRCPCSRGRRS